MSSTLSPFGLRPINHPSGVLRPNAYAITAASAAVIYKYGPVTIQADGSVAKSADNSGRVDGVFMGCEYIDGTGKPVVSTYWPADTAATQVVAYVYDDPDAIYEIQCNGTLAQADIGSHIGTTASGLGSTMTGLSTGYALFSSLSNSVANQLQIVGLSQYVDNAWSDTYTIVKVKLAKNGFVAASSAF